MTCMNVNMINCVVSLFSAFYFYSNIFKCFVEVRQGVTLMKSYYRVEFLGRKLFSTTYLYLMFLRNARSFY